MNEIPEFIQEYIKALEITGKSGTTIKRNYYIMKQFLSWIEDHQKEDPNNISNLSKTNIDCFYQYLKDQNYADATMRRIFSVLNNLFKYHKLTIQFDIKHSDIKAQRPLEAKDFINKEEFRKLLNSMGEPNLSTSTLSAARNYLIDRNISIVYLMRCYGLTPTEISFINMDDINFAQNILVIDQRKITLANNLKQKLLQYFSSIPQKFRPRYHTDDSLFVAFDNRTNSFRYDNDNRKPKRLSVRAIQEMLKDEVNRAGLRKISAVNLRNQCILDEIIGRKNDEYIISKFNFSSTFSLHRYKSFIEQTNYTSP